MLVFLKGWFVVSENFVDMLKARRNVTLRILRIYSSAIERKDFPDPNDDNRRHRPDTNCPKWARPYALHHLVRQKDCFKELTDLEKKIAEIKKSRGKPNGRVCIKHKRSLAKAMSEFLSSEKFDVIFCTCNEAAGQRVRSNLRPRQCIIDECGMAYEPETIVPIGLCEHAVLIGDHMQLQPVIDYQPAKDHGLAISLFERYARDYDDHIYTLKIQYRMVQ